MKNQKRNDGRLLWIGLLAALLLSSCQFGGLGGSTSDGSNAAEPSGVLSGDTESSESHRQDTGSSDTDSSETQPPETKPSETKPETKPSETNPPETKPSETDAPVINPPKPSEEYDLCRDYGCGTNVYQDNRPIYPVQMQKKYGDQYDIYFIAPPAEEKRIFLTFDLGYENGYTEKILDVLKEKNCQGTFFLTGWYLTSAEPIVSRLLEEGHVLGNHTEGHPALPLLSNEKMRTEVMGLHERVQKKYGYTMRALRPPMGKYSFRMLDQLSEMGYTSFQWSFAYYDYDPEKQPEPDAALKRLTGSLHDGGIYLLHAVSKTNAEVLGDFIDAARAAGYTIASLEELLPPQT